MEFSLDIRKLNKSSIVSSPAQKAHDSKQNVLKPTETRATSPQGLYVHGSFVRWKLVEAVSLEKVKKERKRKSRSSTTQNLRGGGWCWDWARALASPWRRASGGHRDPTSEEAYPCGSSRRTSLPLELRRNNLCCKAVLACSAGVFYPHNRLLRPAPFVIYRKLNPWTQAHAHPPSLAPRSGSAQQEQTGTLFCLICISIRQHSLRELCLMWKKWPQSFLTLHHTAFQTPFPFTPHPSLGKAGALEQLQKSPLT